MNQPKSHSSLGFRVIGATKLASGLLLAAAGIGIFRNLHSDIGDLLEHYCSRLHLDPENRLIHEVLTRVGGVTPQQLKLLAVGTFFYAALHIVEGTGLLLLKRWAEYLTVIATGSLLPVELYEVARKVSAVRILVLLVNIAIVVYVVNRLRQDHRDRKAENATKDVAAS